jgi:hypothetical protein
LCAPKTNGARRFPVLSNEKRRAGRQLITSGLLLAGYGPMPHFQKSSVTIAQNFQGTATPDNLK